MTGVGRRYTHRVVVQVVAVLLTATALVLGTAPASNGHAPLILHVPVLTTTVGTPVTIAASTACAVADPCSLTLVYRTTGGGDFPVGSWQRVQMVKSGDPLDVLGERTQNWEGIVPGAAVDSTGVDYYLESATGSGAAVTSPVGIVDLSLLHYHVQALAPPIITHVPPVFAQAGEPVLVDASATCSTASCSARLYYREAPESGVDLHVGDAPNWPSVVMSALRSRSLGDLGRQIDLQANVPASVVTTRGVDYVIEVRDGSTTSYWPGTTHVGPLATDGISLGYWHVHVLEPTRLIHVPVLTADYREDIAVAATASCPVVQTCTGTLYWRTTAADPVPILGDVEGFESAKMAVSQGAELGQGQRQITVSGNIPSSAVDTRGVDYFFEIRDGSTSAWWPGTSHLDVAAVAVPGTRVGYSHVHVNEPPRVVTTTSPVTQYGEDFPVSVAAICVTETCRADLYYRAAGSEDDFTELSMSDRGGNALLGGSRDYAAAIPARDVTTRGLEWYAEVHDGYATAFAPGTSYVGAYIVADGQRLGVHTVRVLEPPHIVHVPPTAAPRGLDLKIEARSNCSSSFCGATLTWTAADGQTFSRPMTSRTTSVEGTRAYTGTIPGASTTGSTVRYRVDATDGHVRDQSLTFTAATSNLLAANSLSGTVNLIPATGGPSFGAPDVTVDLYSKRNGLGSVVHLATAVSDEFGHYEFRGRSAGNYRIDVSQPPGQPVISGVQSKAASINLLGSAATTNFTFAVPALQPAGPVPARTIYIQGPDGTTLNLVTNGGIAPRDVTIVRNNGALNEIAPIAAGPAYQVTLPVEGSLASAELTIPYDATQLNGFREADLTVLHRDDELGWLPFDGQFEVDQGDNTVNISTTDFSSYAVVKLAPSFRASVPANFGYVCRGAGRPTSSTMAYTVDTSGSMNSRRSNVVAVLDGVTAALDDGSYAGILQFDTSASILAPLTKLTANGRDSIATATDSIATSGGGTDIGRGVTSALALLEGAATETSSRVLLLSDGAGDYNPALTDQAIARGVAIDTVDYGSSELLEQVASATGGIYVDAVGRNVEDVVDELSLGLTDNATDTDSDGLTDCEERTGVVTSQTLVKLMLGASDEDVIATRAVSDPTVADTDGDGLEDGAEAGRRVALSGPESYFNSGTLTFAALGPIGVDHFYAGTSDPRLPDTDNDGTGDATEVLGVDQGNNLVHDSDPRLTDTDGDLVSDTNEYAVGTHPRFPNGGALTMDGIPFYNLFQPDRYDEITLNDGTRPASTPHYPLVPNGFFVDTNGALSVTPFREATTYSEDWECEGGYCNEVNAAAAQLEGEKCWTLLFGSNCTQEGRIETVLRGAIALQGVFTDDGLVNPQYAADLAYSNCNLYYGAGVDCEAISGEDQPIDPTAGDGNELDYQVAEAMAAVLAGARPDNLCTKTGGGVYRLVDDSGVTRYVGETNNFANRRNQHGRDARFVGLRLVQVYETDNYDARRGLEQRLFNEVWGGGEETDIQSARSRGSLNGQRPIAVDRSEVLKFRYGMAQMFLDQCF